MLATYTYACRLTRFLKKYDPNKIDSVDATLEKFKGKEEELFKTLVRKYGPEPSASAEITESIISELALEFGPEAKLRQPGLIREMVAKWGGPESTSPTTIEMPTADDSIECEAVPSSSNIAELTDRIDAMTTLHEQWDAATTAAVREATAPLRLIIKQAQATMWLMEMEYAERQRVLFKVPLQMMQRQVQSLRDDYEKQLADNMPTYVSSKRGPKGSSSFRHTCVPQRIPALCMCVPQRIPALCTLFELHPATHPEGEAVRLPPDVVEGVLPLIAAKKITDYRTRLRRFYEKYSPARLGNVGVQLRKFKGKEEAMFETLVRKYGPEPEPSPLDDGGDDESETLSEVETLSDTDTDEEG